jgi:hypothetical protein
MRLFGSLDTSYRFCVFLDHFLFLINSINKSESSKTLIADSMMFSSGLLPLVLCELQQPCFFFCLVVVDAPQIPGVYRNKRNKIKGMGKGQGSEQRVVLTSQEIKKKRRHQRVLHPYASTDAYTHRRLTGKKTFVFSFFCLMASHLSSRW